MSYDTERRSTDRAKLLGSWMPTASTVLDFGTHKGAIAADLAERWLSVTAVAPGLKPIDRVKVIPKKLTPDGIRLLGNFEYVLALSVLHHCTPWRDYYEALWDVAKVGLFVETPRPDEDVPQQPGLAEHFARYDVIGTFPGKRAGHTRDIVYVPCG